MLVSELLLTVRDTLQDDAGDRYSTASLLRALNMGILDMRRSRPDYFIGQYLVATPQVAADTEEVPVPEIAVPGLIAWVAGFAELRDDEYTADGRAKTLLDAYNGSLR